MNRTSFVRCFVLGASLCCLVFVTSARSSPYISPTNIIPTPPATEGGKTQGIGAFTWKIGQMFTVPTTGGDVIGVTPTSVQFLNTTGGVSPPTDPGVFIDSFFDIDYGWDWFVEAGGSITPGTTTGTTSSKLFVGGLSYLPDGTAVYETELLQLDLVASNDLPPGIQLR